MKKLFLLGLNLCIVLTSCSTNPDGNAYRAMMLSDINNHEFSSALLNLQKADIVFDNDDENIYIPYLDEFIDYANSQSVSTDYIIKLKLYKADLFNVYAISYFNNGNYDEAEYFLIEKNAIIAEIYTTESKEYIDAILNMASGYYHMGLFSKAAEVSSSIIDPARKLYGVDNIKYAGIYMSYAMYLWESSYDYNATMSIYKNCEEIFINNKSEYTKENSMLLNNIGCISIMVEDYATAEDYLLKCLNIIEKIYGNMSLDYASSSMNLGSLYVRLGDYARAYDLYNKAARIYRFSIGASKSIDYIRTLQGLTIAEMHLGNYPSAIQSGEECKQIIIQNYSTQLPEYIAILDILASVYYFSGEDQTALQYMLQAIEEGKRIYGEDSDKYALMAQHISSIYVSLNNLAEAERYCNISLAIRKKMYGEQDEQVVESYYWLANIYNHRGMYREAYALYADCSNHGKSIVSKQFAFMSEDQRSKYLAKFEYQYTNVYNQFVFEHFQTEPSLVTFAYDNTLWIKGLLLSTTNSIQQSILHSDNKVLRQLWADYVTIQNNINNTYDRIEKNKLAEQAESIEKEIVSKVNLKQYTKNYTWIEVKSYLNKHSVAIEFIDFDDDILHRYCALLLRHNSEHPELIPLFEEKEVLPYIHPIVDGELKPNKTYKQSSYGSILTEKVWSKILPYIKPGETIYFAPSGLLHQLAIESLPYDEDHTMADVFNLVRLSSTREIVTNKDETHYRTATLYGGIQYDMNATEILAASERYNTEDLLASRGINNDTLNRGSVHFLKGSKDEVENINSLLKQNNLKVQLFTSKNANEESFKALSGKHQNILHIATHGFFWTDSTAREKDYISQRMILLGNDISTPPAIDPLNRCGLLFAGANTALQGHSADLPEGVQDGVLTAKEISLLDLRDADLVVLSACETGTGEITSEGVFGLQRAFKMAGAQTIIMSLWPVHDMATQLLMTEFYRNWITNHQSKREAFRNAQNTVRSQYEEPVYWAGFIMLD